ncbi:sialic acid-binding Ig-like lectin 14 isoform X2 [Carassius gibelio]|uniref:sialic acid-binding Ig-like lectin 14 isoform X2 n=1 Tax=Carassius gibelio TaxID=101364 RepID=UPI002278250A|nr:sialic acid-binding Ig-like lectin 14 isoform X2 [Carassius gibelio]
MMINLHTAIWTLMSLILSGTLAANWTVRVPKDPVYANSGSSVVLECTYDYPEESDQGKLHKVQTEMWCLNESRCITPRYVYHSAGIFPEPSYQGRVKYLGQTGSKNCSLMLSDLRSEDSGVYVFRFITDHLKAKLPGQRGVNLQVTHRIEIHSKCQLFTRRHVHKVEALPQRNLAFLTLTVGDSLQSL